MSANGEGKQISGGKLPSQNIRTTPRVVVVHDRLDAN